MKLWAISDLHVGHAANRRALDSLSAKPDDWLILAGDICETSSALAQVFELLAPRFAQLVWVPGNHELWTTSDEPYRGEAKYRALIDVCREHGVLSPEDEYPIWRGDGGEHILAPMFLLYDYSFAPDGMTTEEALDWAWEEGLNCVDERLLDYEPHASRAAWCKERCRYTAERLDAAVAEHQLPTVLVNHFPLRESHAMLPRIPRFKIWCGTRATTDWPQRYQANVVVYGHLHLRTTRVREHTRFEEVSLGYPKQWDRGIDDYVRQILPPPAVKP